MPRGKWYRSSLVYECVIEVLAAATYFYGTVVWLSVLFLGAVNALQYVSLTVGMFVVVRVTNGSLWVKRSIWFCLMLISGVYVFVAFSKQAQVMDRNFTG